MKRDPIFKHVATVFVAALVLYAISFIAIERFRTAKGPWEVTFQTTTDGEPSIRISQKTLSLTNMTLVFQGARVQLTNHTTSVVFDSPKTNVPFGRVIFLDTTILPGTVTFELFGNEIELLPRVMILNHREAAWKSDSAITLAPIVQ